MSLNAGAGQTFAKGKLTQAADTKIEVMIPPKKRLRIKAMTAEVTTLGTAHVLTAMRPLARTYLSAAAAAAQAVVTLAVDPGNYSANRSPAPRTANNLIGTSDYLVFETPDGTFWFAKVHGSTAPVTNANGTVTVTLASSVPTGGLLANANVWFFGAVGDTDPNSAEVHPAFNLAANGTPNIVGDGVTPFAQSLGLYEPMIISIDNATAASILEALSGVYGP